MAKKIDDTALATTQTTELAVASSRPDFVEQGSGGREHLTQADIQIPRLLIAQKMSPEVDSSDPKFIEGLKIGDFFNGLTKEVYGRAPLKMVILRADPPRYVEFIPRTEGGGVKDPNVAADDPRTKFGPGGEKPVATKFYDYIVALLPFGEDPMSRIVALSFKSTGIKVAKQLNALIQLRNADIYAGVYQLSSVDTQNQHGKFSVPAIANAGWVPTKEMLDFVKHLSEGVQNKDIQRVDDHEGDLDFPSVPAPETSGAGVTSM